MSELKQALMVATLLAMFVLGWYGGYKHAESDSQGLIEAASDLNDKSRALLAQCRGEYSI